MTDYVFCFIGCVAAVATFLTLSFGSGFLFEALSTQNLLLIAVGVVIVACGLFGVILTAASFMAAGEY